MRCVGNEEGIRFALKSQRRKSSRPIAALNWMSFLELRINVVYKATFHWSAISMEALQK